MNLKQGTPHRGSIRRGQSFKCEVCDVKLNGAIAGVGRFLPGMGTVYLLYFFRPDKAAFPVVSELLVRPLITNRLPFSRGYLQIDLDQSPSTRIAGRHGFRDLIDGYIYDEDGQRVGANEVDEALIGTRALQSFRTIDDILSDALGLRRSA